MFSISKVHESKKQDQAKLNLDDSRKEIDNFNHKITFHFYLFQSYSIKC